MFSIIMPAYNSSKTIHASILSVLNQTITDWELIVIDDCSIDDTISIVESFNDQRIILIKNTQNIGVALSRNKGLKISKGKYISFLDSDDIWKRDKCEKQLKYLAAGFNIVCGNYYTFSSEDSLLNVRRSPEIITYKDMLKSNFIGNLTGCYNSEVCGVLMQKIIGHEDYIMWLDLVSAYGPAYCIQDVLAGYRLSSSSLSAKKTKAMKWQWYIYRKYLDLSLIKASCLFFQYIIYALKKRISK
ncbi:TPA: glycosyltransferase family 2 protein [Citrobacter freundii]